MDEGKEMIGGLARAGYTAKGILYGTIGILAAAAAFGSRGGSTDSRGAMAAMLHVMDVLVRVLRDFRWVEQPRDVELCRRLRVRREQKMHVVAFG